MFYEILQDGAGFLPTESIRMDIDGLFVRTISFAYIFKGQQGILLINDSGVLSIDSIMKHTKICGPLSSLTTVSAMDTLSDTRIAAILDHFPELPNEHIFCDSASEPSLIMTSDGTLSTDSTYVAEQEFNIITPPEREKREAINTLNRLFAPLAGNEVHVDVQFNGESYLAEPPLQMSQQDMKELTDCMDGDTKPYQRALHEGLCRGLFDLAPIFSINH